MTSKIDDLSPAYFTSLGMWSYEGARVQVHPLHPPGPDMQL